jgi:hypothetical protein
MPAKRYTIAERGVPVLEDVDVVVVGGGFP